MVGTLAAKSPLLQGLPPKPPQLRLLRINHFTVLSCMVITRLLA